jgi:hypothetical protein
MPGARPYFNGSVSYIAAYASLIGVKELTIFGCDYLYGGLGSMGPRQTETVARYLACMTFWLGFCQARGMKVIVCPASPLLDADFTILEQFYGYIVKPVVDRSYKKEIPEHLGGSFNRCHTDQGALQYMIEAHGVTSMVDVGCGTGGMVELAHERGLKAIGIDGDDSIQRRAPCQIHDFTTGGIGVQPTDMAWSVEFVEHIEEKYIANYMATFQFCKYALITFAPPGTPGHHHVNCQDELYWIEKFQEYGFYLMEESTDEVRSASTMTRDFMRKNGMLFRNTAWQQPS